jgi:hypothetical protein
MTKRSISMQTKVNIFIALFLIATVIAIGFWKNKSSSLPNLNNIFANNTVSFPKDGTKAGEARLYPNPNLTPGKALENVTAEEICTSGYSSRTRDVPSSTKKKVYKNYDTPYPKNKGEWEVDHFIPLGIGGSNDISNLWPEPANPKPGFLEKDVVENYLHTQICNGKIDIKVAQNMIQTDWYRVYLSIPKGFKF